MILRSGRAWLAAALAVAAVGAAPASASGQPPGPASKGTLAAGGLTTRVLLSPRRGIAIVGGPASAAAGRAIMFSNGQRLTGGLTAPASVAGRTARPDGPAASRAAGHTDKLTVTAIGRDGRPANALVTVVNTSVVGGSVHNLGTPHGTGSVKLAAGTYLVVGVIPTGSPPATFTLAESTVRVSAAGTNHITLDARAGRLVDVTIDAPVRRSGQMQLISTFYNGTRYGWVEGMGATPGTGYIVPAQGRRITFGVQTVWRAANAASHTEYDLAAVHRDGIPTHLTYHYRAARLAWVHNTYRAPDATSYGDAVWLPGTPLANGTSRSALLPVASTNAVSPGVPFTGFFEYGSARSPGRAQIEGNGIFAAGTHVTDVWNGAAVGPARRATRATRHANTFRYTVDGFFTDSAPAGLGHDGQDSSATGTITLSAHGTVIATKRYPRNQPGQFTATLPRSPATYTLTATAQRNVPYARLSTSVTAAWRFRSGYAASRQALPLLAVRYQVPGLNNQNQAAPGAALAIPVSVTHHPDAPGGQVRAIKVESSADGGHTWHRVPLRREGTHWVADVASPDSAGFVSLRAVVTTAGGASLVQTIINAYAVAR